MGVDYAEYWPGYGFSPAMFKCKAEAAPVYDVLFIGNPNYDIHRTRARILASMARLSDKYRVGIFYDIWHGEYARLLSSTRIVLNHSVRREMNLRAYEAAASGALLFMEESNLEIRDFLRDRQECVLYREDNVQELLSFYLENETLRAEIAEAGLARIQPESFHGHMKSLVKRLESLDFTRLQARPRALKGLTVSERCYRYGHWMTYTGSGITLAHAEFIKAIQSKMDQPEYWNAAAVVEALAALKVGELEHQQRVFKEAAENHWLNTLKIWPAHLLSWANLGFARLEFGFIQEGIDALYRAFELLTSKTEEMIFDEGCCFFVDSTFGNPTDFNVFRVEWERTVATHVGDSVRLSFELAGLLRWQCARRLGEALLAQDRAGDAKEMFARAIVSRPEMEYAYFGLARSLEKLGEKTLACVAYKEGLSRQPWNFPARGRLTELLIELGDQFGAACIEWDTSLLKKAVTPIEMRS